MMHITHEGESLKLGLNIGWGKMGVRLIWKELDRSLYFRIRHWPPRVFWDVFHR